MPSLNLSINLGGSEPGSAPEPPQFTADWGTLASVDIGSPTVFWASTSGGTTVARDGTQITFAGLGKTISITLTGTSNLRYIKNEVNLAYSASFTVTDGDTLKIGMVGPTFFPDQTITGNITVTNITDSYIIDTIPFTIPGSF